MYMDYAVCMISKQNTLSIRPYKIIVWLFIILFGGWNSFMPITIRSSIQILLSGIGFLYFLLDLYNGRNRQLSVAIICICLICPLIESIQAYRLFGQPIWMGILSMREIWSLFIGYFVSRLIGIDDFIKIMLKYQISMIIIGVICLYIFKIDDTVLSGLFYQLDDVGSIESNELRGSRFTFGQTYLTLCIAYFNSKIIHNPKDKKYILYIIVIFMDYLFVHKGRSGLVSAIIVLCIPYMSNMTFKRFIRFLTIALIGCIIFLSIPQLRDRFLVVYDLFGETRTQGTGDFSGMARLNEILLAFPLIMQHPIFGIGNLSYHFNNGFLGFFGDHFYIGDIGIVGILLIGGINLYIFYLFLFKSIMNSIKNKSGIVKNMIFTLCIYAMICPWYGGNAIWDTPRFTIILITLALMCRKNGKHIYC